MRNRMHWWLAATLVLVAGVDWLAPHMLPVLVWKASLLTLAAWLGYFIDLTLGASGPRPHTLIGLANRYAADGDAENAQHCDRMAASAYLRRAIVVAACILGAAIGS